MSRFVVALLAVAALLTTAMPSRAQSLWDLSDPNVSFRVLRPNVKEDVPLTAVSAMYEVALRLPVGKRFAIVGDYPFAHLSLGNVNGYNGENLNTSSTGIGNPYLGLTSQSPDRQEGLKLDGEIGMRVPLVQRGDTAARSVLSGASRVIGALADINRVEAFTYTQWTLQGAARLAFRVVDGGQVTLRVAPTVMFGADGGSTVTLLNYGLMAGLDNGRTRVVAGITAQHELNGPSDAGSAGQVAVDIGRWFGSVRPGVHLRVPLNDDLGETLSSVVGLSISAKLSPRTRRPRR